MTIGVSTLVQAALGKVDAHWVLAVFLDPPAEVRGAAVVGRIPGDLLVVAVMALAYAGRTLAISRNRVRLQDLCIASKTQALDFGKLSYKT